MWDKIRGWIRVLLTPSCWIQIQPYAEAWDRKLSELMAKERFQPLDEYTAKIGPFTVWIGNHPYSSMTLYKGPGYELRPSRITVLRAHDKMLSDLVYEAEKSPS